MNDLEWKPHGNSRAIASPKAGDEVTELHLITPSTIGEKRVLAGGAFGTGTDVFREWKLTDPEGKEIFRYIRTGMWTVVRVGANTTAGFNHQITEYGLKPSTTYTLTVRPLNPNGSLPDLAELGVHLDFYVDVNNAR